MKIIKVWFDDENVYIRTDVGHTVGNPIAWFSRLANASPEQRNNFEISPFGVHWETLDENLSLDGFFDYKRPGTEQEYHSYEQANG